MTSASVAPRTGLNLHLARLRDAQAAIDTRGHWSAYPELPNQYGEEAAQAGEAAFRARLGQQFGSGSDGEDWVGGERSPWGLELGITYPQLPAERLVAQAAALLPVWRDAGIDRRVGICLEAVDRLNQRSHEIAHAVMHTTGQAFPMAFQAGATHAQDRALEAIAFADLEMRRYPLEAVWEKPQGKRPPLRLHKRYVVVPRGVAVVIGCATFPTWNSYPGLFASLAAGCPVIVKPHPASTLPMALTVSVVQQVLEEADLPSAIVQLAPEGHGQQGLAKSLAQAPAVRVIDYTGSTKFGQWLERESDAAVFTEKAGINCAIVDSTDDYAGMLGNLAMAVSLYSGQMCTTPRQIYVAASGIKTNEGVKTFDEVAADLGAAVERLLGDARRAENVLGAIVNEAVLERVDSAGQHGEIVLESRSIDGEHTDATVRTPVLLVVTAGDEPDDECFGPIAFVVKTEDSAHSLRRFRDTVTEHGSISAGIWSAEPEVVAEAEQVALDVGVSLSENLTGGVLMNQTAAFSDPHATGLNHAANASFVDAAFVSPRFAVVELRRPLEGDG